MSRSTHRSESRRSSLRKAVNIAATAATVLAAATWFMLLRPEGLGGPAGYVSVSGPSMEPTYYNGDFVVSQKKSSYGVGDVLIFRVPKGDVGEGAFVIHRVIGGSAADGYVLQGDNRNSPDIWRPKPVDVVGKVWFQVPGARRWMPLVRTPMVLALFAGMWATWVVMAPSKNRAETAPT